MAHIEKEFMIDPKDIKAEVMSDEELSPTVYAGSSRRDSIDIKKEMKTEEVSTAVYTESPRKAIYIKTEVETDEEPSPTVFTGSPRKDCMDSLYFTMSDNGNSSTEVARNHDTATPHKSPIPSSDVGKVSAENLDAFQQEADIKISMGLEPATAMDYEVQLTPRKKEEKKEGFIKVKVKASVSKLVVHVPDEELKNPGAALDEINADPVNPIISLVNFQAGEKQRSIEQDPKLSTLPRVILTDYFIEKKTDEQEKRPAGVSSDPKLMIEPKMPLVAVKEPKKRKMDPKKKTREPKKRIIMTRSALKKADSTQGGVTVDPKLLMQPRVLLVDCVEVKDPKKRTIREPNKKKIIGPRSALKNPDK